MYSLRRNRSVSLFSLVFVLLVGLSNQSNLEESYSAKEAHNNICKPFIQDVSLMNRMSSNMSASLDDLITFLKDSEKEFYFETKPTNQLQVQEVGNRLIIGSIFTLTFNSIDQGQNKITVRLSCPIGVLDR